MSVTGYKIADGTDLLTTFQSVLSTNANTFSSPSNVFYGNGSNLTGVTFANAVTTDTTQTITALKTFSGTTGGIKMTSSCIRGRTDGFGFTGNAGFATQPIGYTINHTSPSAAVPANGNALFYEGLPSVDAGVWLVDGTINVQKVNGAQWAANSLLAHGFDGTGGTIVGNTIVHNFNNTITTLGFKYPSKTFTATSTNGTAKVKPYFAITYATGGATCTQSFQMTKIA